ncbi:hypothetical protein [Pseudoponticoccus marisrubri]|uniref:DUF2244 domain-containing protein n=1 Tax=Pseudoponticoccus marisrubri TaxID=1685382 RepID=A0A0W7WLJ6_9RHOB|nr:hypothetical protein [Pseudoponticoccus marisrubri]KUF11475.1 hypothetical protein AVJ23_06845 [Pseudoponticoccus marisrubri]
MSPLQHEATGRTWTPALVLAVLWSGLLALWLLLEAAPWIVGLLALVTLPAASDFATARRAWLRLDAERLSWGSGRTQGEVALAQLDHVRFETRLDLSVRVRLVLPGGRRITLPQDALPPPKELTAALEARGIRCERHHFSLL